jgi:hypothetical protein
MTAKPRAAQSPLRKNRLRRNQWPSLLQSLSPLQSLHRGQSQR